MRIPATVAHLLAASIFIAFLPLRAEGQDLLPSPTARGEIENYSGDGLVHFWSGSIYIDSAPIEGGRYTIPALPANYDFDLFIEIPVEDGLNLVYFPYNAGLHEEVSSRTAGRVRQFLREYERAYHSQNSDRVFRLYDEDDWDTAWSLPFAFIERKVENWTEDLPDYDPSIYLMDLKTDTGGRRIAASVHIIAEAGDLIFLHDYCLLLEASGRSFKIIGIRSMGTTDAVLALGKDFRALLSPSIPRIRPSAEGEWVPPPVRLPRPLGGVDIR